MMLVLVACDQRSSQAENQAVEAIKLIVTEPGNTSKLDELSHGRAASIVESIQNDLPSKIAVEYIQARQQQGIRSRFEASTLKTDDPLKKHIVVNIIQGQPSPPKDYQSHFLVLLQREFNQDWFVTGISLHAHTSGLYTEPDESNNKTHITFPPPSNSIPDSPAP